MADGTGHDVVGSEKLLLVVKPLWHWRTKGKRRSSRSTANMPPMVPHAPPIAMAAKASTVAIERPDRIVTEAVKIR